jgi:SAM-dependent methyltransferase
MPYFYIVAGVLLFLTGCRRESGSADASSQRTGHHERPVKTAVLTDPVAVPSGQQGRDIWQKPDLVIALLGDLQGKTVADIGAGAGYFAFRLVPKAEKVIAIDIDKTFIHFMDSISARLPDAYQQHFETRLARFDNPLLAPGEADAVILVNTYGYLENRVTYLKTMSKGMTPDAQLLVIDFKKNAPHPDPYRVDLRQVESELTNAGFKVRKLDTQLLDYQYVVLATK